MKTRILTLIKEYWLPVYAAIALAAGLFLNIINKPELGDYVFMSSIILGGIPLIFATLKPLFKGQYSIDLIALISIIGALIVPEYLAGAIIILMLSGGEALESFAQRRAKSSLKALLKISPKIAHRITENGTEDVDVKDLQINDVVLIKPSEVVPIDGIIIEGNSALDESSLTGESIPVNKKEGDEVLSGTINQNGVIQVRVTKLSKDSAFSQIVKLVKNAEKNKAPINRLADQYGAFFVPAVLAFAAVVFIISRDLRLTYSVFVVATPCPLLIATPVAIISGIARSARRGAIVKNGGALESLASTNAIISDKTGTLTKGEPEVIEYKSISQDYSDKDIINLAAGINQFSTHVLAHSTLQAADKNLIFKYKIENYADHLGKGSSATIDGKDVWVGSLSLIELEEKVECSEEIHKVKQQKNNQGYIISFVTVDQRPIGYITFADKLRDNAKDLVADLRHIGIQKIVLATGDVNEVGERIANEVGIHEYYAETKPQDKADIVKSLNQKGYKVTMIGDGVNDAPAMTLANTGIAIGARGSTIASEAADIVLLTNDITKISDVILIAKKSMSIAKSGIIFGMALSFIGMIFAALGYLPPVFGALSQELIDVITILNALRVLVVKIKH